MANSSERWAAGVAPLKVADTLARAAQDSSTRAHTDLGHGELDDFAGHVYIAVKHLHHLCGHAAMQLNHRHRRWRGEVTFATLTVS